MGLTLFTNNAFSTISDPDSFTPGFDTSGLKRMEIFTYSGIGGNLMPGEPVSVAISNPQIVSGTPYAEFTNYGNLVPHVRLGMPDAAVQTWLVLFDPNNSAANRMIMSSYAGSNATDRPGASITIDAQGRLVMLVGRLTTDTGVYGVQFVTLPAFDVTKPVLVAITLDNKVCTIKNLTNGLATVYTLTATQERAFGPEIYVGKCPFNAYGDSSAKSRVAAYMVFNRILSDSELAEVKSYLLKCIQAKFPAITF